MPSTPPATVTSATASSPLNGRDGSLVWCAPFLNYSGYGEEARGFLRGLSALGWHVVARSVGEASPSVVTSLDRPEGSQLRRALEERPTAPVTAVFHVPGYAVGHVKGAARTIARTMFETDSLPRPWVQRLNCMHEVWVPSSFNAETFVEAGVSVPVRVVPGGVDTDLWRPGLPGLGVPGTRGAVFLSVCAWSYRKAVDVLLRAWARAFGPDDPVSLVLRCDPAPAAPGHRARTSEAHVADELARLGLERRALAPIVVLGTPLPAADMPRLMAAADVFVGVSRGEGWGRPLLEAMSCGLPVIGTRWSGNLEFMTDDNSLLVDVERLVEIDERMEAAHFRGMHWAEPSAEHLSELLARSASDADLRSRLGSRARADVVERWSWAHAAAIADARLSRRPVTPALAPAGRAPRVRVRWCGDFYADSGFAKVNRDLCTALAGDERFDVEPVTAEAPPYPDDRREVLQRILAHHRPLPGAHPEVDVEVRDGWPPNFAPPAAGRLVVMQPWEFGGVPADWVRGVQAADEVWVPTTWVRDGYLQSGVPSDKVVVIPHGVDTTTFAPGGPKLPLKNGKGVRLLFVGGAIARKGFDLLLDTYLETFSRDDDVCLVLKLFGADGPYRHIAMDERAKAAVADPGAPAIEIVEGRLTTAEMAALYRACDVLVHPYRGEGFALPVAEAMACGLPTVVTGYGACLDYCDKETSWLLPATLERVGLPGVAASPAGFWMAEPSTQALAASLRRAVEDADLRRAKGAAARRRIEGAYGIEQAAERVRERLVALCQDPLDNGGASPKATAGQAGRPHDRVDALATLTATGFEKVDEALTELRSQLATLRRETSVLRDGTVALPPQLVVQGRSGRPVIGFREDHDLEGGYAGFEDVFRAPEATIRRLQHFYLPLLEMRAPVFDFGCGRGEMLELLRDAGVEAYGVDADASMAARAKAKGLDVTCDDALAHLATLPEGSLGTVFSAQVIEHLRAADVEAFFVQAQRALREGGILVAETVNPHCAFARKNFWIDLTHQRQVFPEVAVLLCRHAGFKEATVLFPEGSGDLLDDLLTCLDYTVVATR
jgi:glycosyltransferase involved in cell wall biosynthesis/SAM-dependent methyltransferase